jgi:hypothetical protein
MPANHHHDWPLRGRGNRLRVDRNKRTGSISPRSDFPDASADPTDARKATVRRFGRSHRRRLVRGGLGRSGPTRAKQPTDDACHDTRCSYRAPSGEVRRGLGPVATDRHAAPAPAVSLRAVEEHQRTPNPGRIASAGSLNCGSNPPPPRSLAEMTPPDSPSGGPGATAGGVRPRHHARRPPLVGSQGRWVANSWSPDVRDQLANSIHRDLQPLPFDDLGVGRDGYRPPRLGLVRISLPSSARGTYRV